MNTQPPSQWMTQQQVAAMLGVSVETLRRWRKASAGPVAHRLGPRVIRYERAVVIAWLSAQAAS